MGRGWCWRKLSEGDWEEIERERVMGRAQREGGEGMGGVKGGRVEDERGGVRRGDTRTVTGYCFSRPDTRANSRPATFVLLTHSLSRLQWNSNVDRAFKKI